MMYFLKRDWNLSAYVLVFFYAQLIGYRYHLNLNPATIFVFTKTAKIKLK